MLFCNMSDVVRCLTSGFVLDVALGGDLLCENL